MKHVIQILIVGFLLLLTVCTAAYRLDPEVSPEVEAASGQSLSDRITGFLTDTVTGVQEAVGGVSQSVTEAAVDTALGAVADVERTGEYSANGSEILDVSVPADAVSAVTQTVSGELGGMVTADSLVTGLNSVEGVNAVQNEDGSVTVTLPEDVYEAYQSQIASYLTGN